MNCLTIEKKYFIDVIKFLWVGGKLGIFMNGCSDVELKLNNFTLNGFESG